MNLSVRARWRGSFWLLLPSLCLFLVLNFLGHYDVIFSTLTMRDALVNVIAVLAVSLSGMVALSGFLALLETLTSRAEAFSLLVCSFGFYVVNLQFLKLRLITLVRPLGYAQRTVLSVLALLAFAFLFWRLLPRLRAWRRQVENWPALPLLGPAALLTLAALAWLPGEPMRAPSGELPSILMVTQDGLAAQDTSLYGFRLPTTPNLERLASRAYVFEGMHSNSNSTPLSMPCFQGYFPVMERGEPTAGFAGQGLLEVLRDHGYVTYLISFHPSRFFSLRGVDESIVVRSFESHPLYRLLALRWSHHQLEWLSSMATEEWMYYNPFDPRIQDEYHLFWTREHHPSERMLDQAVRILEAHPRGAFVWVHMWIPHYPYRPVPPFRGRLGGPSELPGPRYVNGPYLPVYQGLVDRLRLSYDEYVLQGDAMLGAAFERMALEGLLERIYVVVSSDHGQSFQDGYLGHWGALVTEPLLRIPLVLKLPGQSQGVRLKTPAQQLDLAPTLLDLLGLPVPASMQGESLVPYLADPLRLSPRPKVCISTTLLQGVGGQAAVYQGDFKLAFSPRLPQNPMALYDLVRDPGRNVVDRFPEVGERLREAYRTASGAGR